MQTNIATNASLTDALTVTVPPSGKRFSVGVFAITALGAYVAATTGTVALTKKTGVNGRFEPMLDASGAAIVITMATPVTIEAIGDIREIKATPTTLTGATVVGMKLSVSAYE